MVWDPFKEITKMHEEMDKLHGRMFSSHRLLPHDQDLDRYGGFRLPLADIKKTEKGLIASFEIPGADKKDIDLSITEHAVVVKVEKNAEKEVKGKSSYLYESRSHSFYRTLPLPIEVNVDEAKASYHDGILKVEIPKVKKLEAKKKKIGIND